MKKIFTLLLIACFVQFSYAQEKKIEEKKIEEKKIEEKKIEEKKKSNDDINTIFSKDNLKVTGGFLSPEFKVGDVHEDISLLAGAKIGMTFNRKFTLGLAGYGVVNHSDFAIDPDEPVRETVRINMGYGGLLMEYTFLTKKKIHFTIPVVVGVGGVSLYEEDEESLTNYDYLESSSMFVVEPGLNIELNLFKFMRVNLGASYRFVSESSLNNISDEDLTNYTINASFKFGFF